MIKCSKCQATLPDGAGHCQFCGNTFTPQPARRRDNDEPDYVSGGTPKWVWPAYYLIAGWWIVSGAWDIFEVLRASAAGSLFGMIALAISVVTILVGVGLILRVELARGIVNILCFLQIIGGALGLLSGFAMSLALGLFGAIAMVMSALQIGMAILMMFVIGETESRAPNF